ncbi:Werner syndrome ATP-dependent helicase homolog (Exonuclease WRN) (Focus-forming activity 1) (FFA-1) [Durusdinium trenchii]|uniref:Werner syndrome ATP-dependent helicase homolog (Exonuclease WRN) (Focus-forming activity 1) (FFA-1) n=1 Tax=Durusdinium trenchii TaxID=1381693 RepID=A0ABP0L3B5_9DINO
MYRRLCARKTDDESASYSSFTGQVIVVDLSELDSKSSEDFQGSKWLENKSRNRQPVGFDLEWPPDRMKDSNNPIALMQFSDDETALLVRTHRTERWLPNILKQVLSSENCQKICVGWDGADKKKMKSSFELEVAGLLDLATLASQKGLRERGLKALAEHFGLHMKKETRVARSNWAALHLTEDQIAYAAEDAYFTYILKDKLEALPDLEEEGVDLAVEGQLALQPGWKEAGIVRKHDGLHCALCSQGPMNTHENVKMHLRGNNHVKKTKALQGLGPEGHYVLTQEQENNGIYAGDGTNGAEKGEWKCRLCEHVVIKSVQSIESHIKSKQHQKAVSPEAEVNSPSKDPFDRLWNIPDYVDFAQQELVCTLCSSKSASVLGMYQHLAGDKHYRRVQQKKEKDIIWIKERNQLEYTETGRPVVRKGFVRGQPRAEAEAKAAQGSKEGKEATGEESRWTCPEGLPDGWAMSFDDASKRYYYWPVADRTKTQWHYPAANGAKPARTESRLEEKVEKPPEKKVEKKVEEAPKLSKTSERTSKLPEVDDEWEEHETEFGCKFYYNLKTQTSHWQRSLDPAPSKPPLSRRFEMRGERVSSSETLQSKRRPSTGSLKAEKRCESAGRECDGVAEIVLPPGWRQVADEAGKTFYWDAETQKSSWNPPPNYKQKDWQRKVTGEGAYWIWIGTELESSMSFWESDPNWSRRVDLEGRIYWSHRVDQVRFYEPAM